MNNLTRTRRVLVPYAAICALTAIPRPASAAPPRDGEAGLDLRLHRPSVDAEGYLTVNGSETLRGGEVGFRVAHDVAFGLLPREALRSGVTSDASSSLVDELSTALFTFNAGLGHGALLGASLPVQGVSGTDVRAGHANDATPQRLRSAGIGDVELHGKISFARAGQGGFGAAALLRVDLPTGARETLRGQPGASIWPSVAVEAGLFRVVRAGAELGYRVVTGRGTEVPFRGAPVVYDDQLRFAAALEIVPLTRLALTLDTYLAQIVRAFGESRAISWEVAAGAKYQAHDSVAVLVGGAVGPHAALQNARGRLFLALNIAPSSADFDGDGYTTHDDACPRDAEDFDGFEDGDGCRDDDDDADAVLDEHDDCPRDPEDADGVDDGDGCPEQPIPDTDADGLDDYADDLPAPTGAPP